MIPIWMIVFGSISLLQVFVNISKRFFLCKIQRRKSTDSSTTDTSEMAAENHEYTQLIEISSFANYIGSIFEGLLTILMISWLLTGTYLVFSYYTTYSSYYCQVVVPNYPELMAQCCHSVPYLFSFAFLVFVYGIFVMIGLCLCFAFCMIGSCAHHDV